MAASMVDLQSMRPPLNWYAGRNGNGTDPNSLQPLPFGGRYPTTGYDVAQPPLPPHNEREMNREQLLAVLVYFSQLVAQQFGGRPIRLVVHGGACMLLHPWLYALSQQQSEMSPSLPRRTTTRDVDYIHRSFVSEMAAYGVTNAASKLAECVKGTARKFGLGLDWMNSDADVALPMAHDPSGNVYDPIYTASIQPNNVKLHTIFQAPDGLLTLISVTPFWAVSLKLARYARWDPGDICLLLRNGTVLSNTQWTPEMLETWLLRNCWAMGYHYFDAQRKAQMKNRILDAIKMLAQWNSAVAVGSNKGGGATYGSPYWWTGSPPGAQDRERGRVGSNLSAHDAMGGGEVVGGGGESATTNGWWSSFGPWPTGAAADGSGTQPGTSNNAIFPTSTPMRMPMMAARNMGFVPGPGAENVRDWGSKDDSPSGSRSKSRSRAASPRSRSRNNSPDPQEIFIPPGPELQHPDDRRGYDYSPHGYGYGQAQSQPQPQTQQIPQNANRAPERYGGIYAPNPNVNANVYDYRSSHNYEQGQAQAPVQAAYGLESFNSSLGAMLQYPYQTQGQTHGYGHTRGDSFQPVIPTLSSHTQKARKTKDKQRKKDRERARASKWASRSPLGRGRGVTSDSSDTDSDREEHQEEASEEERRRRLSEGRPWHNTYTDAGRNHQQPQSQGQDPPQMRVPPRERDAQPTAPGWAQAQARERGRSSAQSGPSRPSSRNPSRNSSRNPSRNSSRNVTPNPDPNFDPSSTIGRTPKHRPPALDLTPPPVIPAALPAQRPYQVRAQDDTPPPRYAQLAQYQFEQQRKEYEMQLQQQREREQQQPRQQQQHLQVQQQQQQRQVQQQHQAQQAQQQPHWPLPAQRPQHYYHQQQQPQPQQHRARPSINEMYH